MTWGVQCCSIVHADSNPTWSNSEAERHACLILLTCSDYAYNNISVLSIGKIQVHYQAAFILQSVWVQR